MAVAAEATLAEPWAGTKVVDKTWTDRLKASKDDRTRYELAWKMALAFLAGQQWVGWDTESQRVVNLPNLQDRFRHTVNVITPSFWTIQGKLQVEDLMPDVTFKREDTHARGIAHAVRSLLQYAWDDEFGAEEAYLLASMERVACGLGGIRVTHDPLFGERVSRLPMDENGKPVLDSESLQYIAENGMLPSGALPKLKEVNEGGVKWDSFGPFQTFPPPGVAHESRFPWLILGRPMPVDLVGAYYPDAKGLKEESIEQVDTLGALASGGDQPTPSGGDAMLKGHLMLYTGYEFPNAKNQRGKTYCWAGNRELHNDDELPLSVNNQAKAGIIFLKYHMVPGRFWPMGLVEPMIGAQRQRNISRSQNIEIKDRMGLGRIYAHKGAIDAVNRPKGYVAEVVELRPGAEFPKETQGVGPGAWIEQEKEINDADLAAITGLSEPSLGQVPQGVSAYSAFALLVQQDDRRVGVIRALDRIQIRDLTAFSIEAIRKYWPDEKKIPLFSPEDGLVDYLQFRKEELPAQVFVKLSTTAPLPKSQAAEAQLILDIYDRAISGGQPLPIDWLYDSLRAGRAQPLPKREMRVQEQSADYENELMAGGKMIEPTPHDNDQIHVQRHRAAQDAYRLVAAQLPEFQYVYDLLEQHVQMHMQSMMQKAMTGQQVGQPTNGQQSAPSQAQGGQAAGMGPLQSAQGQPNGPAQPPGQMGPR